MRIALKFAYDGRNYYGFARQPGLKTIEGEILKYLLDLGYIKDIKNSYFRTASRTDKGVSSLGNVIAFNSINMSNKDLEIISEKNSEIIFYGMKKVNEAFSPRYAKYRIYRYYIKLKGNIENLIKICDVFSGKHNFSNFARIEKNKDPIRIIDNIIITKKNGFITIDFYAQTFLWNQIRRIISAVKRFDEGKITKEDISIALENPKKNVDFGLASSEPLFLKDVIYDFDFKYNSTLIKKAQLLENEIISQIFC